jgi:hypothetical protein
MLRLALNVASTRVILVNGHEGTHAAGKVVGVGAVRTRMQLLGATVGGNNLLIQRNDFTNVKRYLFDSEPAAVHGWKDVKITSNTGESGNLGYFQFAGHKTSQASGLLISNNTIVKGHLVMAIGNGSDALRSGATITGNRSLDPTEFRRSNLHRSLITISRWSSVDISNNSNRVVANSRPFALNTDRSNATVGLNNWSGR